MKTLFIESKRSFEDVHFDFNMLPERIGLLSTIQFLPIAEKIKKELSKKRKVITSKTLFNESQILGCDVSAGEKIKDKVDAFLLLSTGKWHALMLSELKKPVFVYDGEKTEKLSDEDMNKFNIRKKAALMKFLSEDRIGIIVSLKHGQFKMDEANKLKDKIEKKGKKAFLFITDTLNIADLDNYNIHIWVNTACPGIFFDSNKIINLKDIV